MSKKDMLGKIVRELVTLPVETHGVAIDLLTKLKDPKWLAATKSFLRMENPWPGEVKLWERVSDTVIRVNLDATPKLPFPGAEVEWNDGSGWVTVERRGNDLYVDGKKVLLYLVPGQKTGAVQGYELRTQLKGQQTLHPNVLDAIFENQHLIPESWKTDEQGRIRSIYFWAVGFRDSDGSPYVRCLCWSDGQWCWSSHWLGYRWDDQDPAAALASERLGLASSPLREVPS